MTITYLRWRDAMTEEAAEPATRVKPRLAELQEIGFLLGETDEAVLIGMELNGGDEGTSERWRLHVPKVNVVERRDWDLDKLMAQRKSRKRA